MARHRSTLPILTLLLILVASGFGPGHVLRAERRATLLVPARASITSSALKGHVGVLADDSFEGREAGSRGGRAAAGYIIDRLKKYGLKPAGDGGSFGQNFQAGYRNLLASLPGSDNNKAQEIVLVGAHYDHVGYGNQSNSYGPFGYVHNGADDNASGTAALLELAQALAAMPQKPRRTILFAFWDAEEKGLLGSKHWINQPTVRLADVKLSVNMDMVGNLRNNRLEIYGSRTAVGFRRRLAEANRSTMLDLHFDWQMKADSDHHTFYQYGLPVVMLHTGLHDNYHRPSDDAHRINNQGIQQVSRLLLDFVFDSANANTLPAFRQQSRQESDATRRRLEAALPQPAPRLGLSWRETPDDESQGVRVSSVVFGSAAQKAGIRTGDLLLEFDGTAIQTGRDLRLAVLAAAPSTTAVVQRPAAVEANEASEDETDADAGPAKVAVGSTTLKVILPGQPTRLGISWQTDTAEPDTVLLNRVVPGSPAGLAGLRLGDRIWTINGRTFSGTDELIELATTLPGPLTLTIERRGRVRQITLQVPAPKPL